MHYASPAGLFGPTVDRTASVQPPKAESLGPPVAAPKLLDKVPDVLTVANSPEALRRSLRVPEAAFVAYLGGVDGQEAVRRPLRTQSFPEIPLSDRGSVASGHPAPTGGSW